MIITGFSADGFKNLKNAAIEPSPNVNVIYGENAQGKTNLIEAIWILSGAKSFRGSKERDMICFSEEYARLELKLTDSEREQEINCILSRNPRERKIYLNGVKQSYLTSLFGALKCVVFTPEDLELSKGSPDIRRDFIDLCISQIKPRYAKTAAKYEKVLTQRNALLKNISLGFSHETDLDVWDDQLARLGAYISVMKNQYSKKLCQFSKKLYSEISGGRENLELRYISTIFDSLEQRNDWQTGLYSEYLEKLRASRSDDIKFGYTSLGVHRDDLGVYIDGSVARDFGSQGQNRSAALSMKLSQAYILFEETGEMPVILLDDVLSELDKSRREFIISKLKDMQIFITCCEPIRKLRGKKFLMEAGRISEKVSTKKKKAVEK